MPGPIRRAPTTAIRLMPFSMPVSLADPDCVSRPWRGPARRHYPRLTMESAAPSINHRDAIKPTLIVTHGDHRRAGIARECLVAAGCPIVDWEWLPADEPITPPP